MSDRDPRWWEQQLEAHWITYGTLSDEAITALQATSEGRQRYRAWLALERAMGDVSLPLDARLQAPSPEELQRGARMVLARLTEATLPAQQTPDRWRDALHVSEIQDEDSMLSEMWDEDTPTSALEDADASASAMWDEDTPTAHLSDHTSTSPPARAAGRSLSLYEPVLGEPALDVAAAGTEVGTTQGMWSRLMPLCVGIGSTMLVLLMLQQVPGLLPPGPRGVSPAVSQWVPPPGRSRVRLPYAGAKGPEPGLASTWLQLYFGVSAKDASQPQRRGHDQMRVSIGSWLYFLFEKSHTAGYVTLLSWQEGVHKEPLAALFPAPGKGAFVKASQTRWALSEGGVALRYQLSAKQRAVGFVGILTPKPLTSAEHLRLRQLSQGWKERPLALGQRMAIAAALGISVRRVDGFRVTVSAAPPGPPNAPQPTKAPR